MDMIAKISSRGLLTMILIAFHRTSAVLHKKAAPKRTLLSSKVAPGLSMLGKLSDNNPGQDHYREKRRCQNCDKPVQ